jgi:methyl-accepting chemotaxis protein
MAVRTMKLQLRLPLAFLLVLCFVIIPSFWGLISLSHANYRFNDEVLPTLKQQDEIRYVALSFKTQIQEWKNVLLRGKDPAQLNKYWAAFQKEEQFVNTASHALEKSLTDEAEKTRIRQFINAHQLMSEKYHAAFSLFQAAGFDAEKGDAAVKGMDREPAKLLNEATDYLEKKSAAIAQAAISTGDQAKKWATIIILSSSMLGLMIGVLISRSIIKIIGGDPQDVSDIAAQIATGNLTPQIDVVSTDQKSVMHSMKKMNDSLHHIVGQVRDASDVIVHSSGEIAAGNIDLSERTENQASSLEETAASMEELHSTVRNNADNALRAFELANIASGVATKGGSVVSQVVDTMDSINECSKKIADIISVIDGIAFQTNILALNAAVEAARAGEQGRGFAVVASEVRTLAQRSASAAKEIKVLIDDSVQKVALGTQLVGHAGTTMSEMVNSVQRVSGVLSEITAANKEQVSGIDQINTAITDMDQITQQNAALVEESSAAATAMNKQALELAKLVSIFRLRPQL